VFKSQINIGLI